ncbi:hypothetical protein ASPWEDRAFT_177859 [Aspergillus wentii DTO 134E9]|uniref:Uncharacterized protein n=1 Tax=Aspergillus wentii DTO 134E9 TaxID=1073089 RepID=A0A1L9R3P5_ASPWE|nr:uncharacterized protein ASPWEDRAFT_177859 [Aspergillus wentii DTO 134E9]KAI9923373.1 hypothetical protein MW887_009936 [Aspergillus wentii]OJJ29549.1 hypothetical protein ASPWEDRAFT_177859 [Aspergillus wentii DTO 134E9]
MNFPPITISDQCAEIVKIVNVIYGRLARVVALKSELKETSVDFHDIFMQADDQNDYIEGLCRGSLHFVSCLISRAWHEQIENLPVVEMAHLQLCNALELFYQIQCDVGKLLASLSIKQQNAVSTKVGIAAQVRAQEARVDRIETDLDWAMVLQQHLHLLKTRWISGARGRRRGPLIQHNSSDRSGRVRHFFGRWLSGQGLSEDQ